MKQKTSFGVIFAALLVSLALCQTGSSQTTAFTYTGSLKDAGTAANGSYDFEFALFDTVAGGNQVGSTLTRSATSVADGIFSVQLDFGSQFPGAGRFLEVRVRPAGQPGITTLAPRQVVGSAPYAIKSLNAENAANATSLGGITAGQFVVTGDPRLSDARTPLPGSPNYVQNGFSMQPATNFNISGNGTAAGSLSANIVEAQTHFRIAGARVLDTTGGFNLFVGPFAGNAITTGIRDTIAGHNAGLFNTTGSDNAFFGSFAGQANTTGSNNSFFGSNAGASNTTGTNNVFVGDRTGERTTTGSSNAFIGSSAGTDNTTGISNVFVGHFAGRNNTTGSSNTFIGRSAGTLATTGDGNAIVGAFAGDALTTGGRNSVFGRSAGSAMTTAEDNSFFGYFAGVLTTGGSNAFFGANAGDSNTAGASNSFFGASAGGGNTTGNFNTFVGTGAGLENSTGSGNAFFGLLAGFTNTSGMNNTFIGPNAGNNNTTGDMNTAIGTDSDVVSNVSHATAIGADAVATASNRVQLGRNGTDTVSIGDLTAASGTHVCINGTVLSSCSSSMRYKDRVLPLSTGLDLIKKLRPVTFYWKERSEADLGLIAEEVAAAEPLLVTHNKTGAIEGVKYDQLTIFLINAVKQQQEQIDRQQAQIETLTKTIRRQRLRPTGRVRSRR